MLGGWGDQEPPARPHGAEEGSGEAGGVGFAARDILGGVDGKARRQLEVPLDRPNRGEVFVSMIMLARRPRCVQGQEALPAAKPKGTRTEAHLAQCGGRVRKERGDGEVLLHWI